MKLPFIIKSRRKDNTDRHNFNIMYDDLKRAKQELSHMKRIMDSTAAGVVELERQAYVKGVKDGSAYIKQQVMQRVRNGVE